MSRRSSSFSRVRRASSRMLGALLTFGARQPYTVVSNPILFGGLLKGDGTFE